MLHPAFGVKAWTILYQSCSWSTSSKIRLLPLACLSLQRLSSKCLSISTTTGTSSPSVHPHHMSVYLDLLVCGYIPDFMLDSRFGIHPVAVQQKPQHQYNCIGMGTSSAFVPPHHCRYINLLACVYISDFMLDSRFGIHQVAGRMPGHTIIM